MAGLVEPTAGDLPSTGTPIDGPGADRGMVFQAYTLYPWMTVRHNVEFGPEAQGHRTRRARASWPSSLIEEMGLTEFADSIRRSSRAA